MEGQPPSAVRLSGAQLSLDGRQSRATLGRRAEACLERSRRGGRACVLRWDYNCRVEVPMRVIGLLLISCLCLVSICAGQNSNPSQAAPTTEAALAAPVVFPNSPYADSVDQSSRIRRLGRFFAKSFDSDEPTCYAMRTYTVARVHPHSDETRPARYTTCPKAWKFDLRNADATVRDARAESNSR